MKELFQNVSNAFVSTVADMGNTGVKNYKGDNGINDGNNVTMKTLQRENRYMYLALLVLAVMIISNVFFTTE